MACREAEYERATGQVGTHIFVASNAPAPSCKLDLPLRSAICNGRCCQWGNLPFGSSILRETDSISILHNDRHCCLVCRFRARLVDGCAVDCCGELFSILT